MSNKDTIIDPDEVLSFYQYQQRVKEQQERDREEALKLIYPPEAPEWSNNAAKHINNYLEECEFNKYLIVVSSINLQEKLERMNNIYNGSGSLMSNTYHSWNLVKHKKFEIENKNNDIPIPGVIITGVTSDLIFTIIKEENDDRYHFYKSIKENSKEISLKALDKYLGMIQLSSSTIYSDISSDGLMSAYYKDKKENKYADFDLEATFDAMKGKGIEIFKLKEVLVTDNIQEIEETLVSVVIDKYWRN